MRLPRLVSIALAGLLLAALAAIGPSVATAMPGSVVAASAMPAAGSTADSLAPLAIPQGHLTATGGGPGDHIGYSVAMSGDTALVGEEYNGRAYVFSCASGSWTQQAALTSAGSFSNNWFGSAVALDGDTAVVGARWDNVGSNYHQGAAYVFTRSGTSWSQQAMLTASDGAADNQLGLSVAISGDTALVGAGGAAYVFTRSGTSWSQQAKLTASDGTRLGAIAISGDTAVAGGISWNGGQGAAYVFTRSGTSWSQQAQLTASDGLSTDGLGRSVAISGGSVLVGTGEYQGKAYVFTRSGTSWSQQQKLIADDGTPYAQFGYSVALVGDTALIGAPWDKGYGVPANSHGAAYVYTRSGGTWSKTSKMATTAFNSWYGYSVALSPGLAALVGAPYDDVGSPVALIDEGSAWVYPPPALAVTSAGFSNAIAYSLKSLLSTKMSFNANMSGVKAKLVVHIPAYKLKPAADWTVYNGNCANAAGAKFTLPAWNGKNPANGAVAPYAANFGWTLTITKAGQTTVTKTGSILLSTIYFKRVGSSAAGAAQLHVGYLQGPPYASGGVNIYVSATTTAPSDRLAIRVTGPAGSRYAAVPTNSPWKLPGTGLPTGRLTGTTAIRANGNYNFYVTGTTNVSYNISVIE